MNFALLLVSTLLSPSLDIVAVLTLSLMEFGIILKSFKEFIKDKFLFFGRSIAQAKVFEVKFILNFACQV